MPYAGTFNPRHQCEGKVRHGNKADAKAAVKAMERKVGRMQVYRCPHCGGWHTGHPVPREHRSTRSENVNDPSAVASCLGPDRTDGS